MPELPSELPGFYCCPSSRISGHCWTRPCTAGIGSEHGSVGEGTSWAEVMARPLTEAFAYGIEDPNGIPRPAPMRPRPAQSSFSSSPCPSSLSPVGVGLVNPRLPLQASSLDTEKELPGACLSIDGLWVKPFDLVGVCFMLDWVSCWLLTSHSHFLSAGRIPAWASWSWNQEAYVNPSASSSYSINKWWQICWWIKFQGQCYIVL